MESKTRYDNVTKDCWRRWVWNQMRSRLHYGSNVLVLCGDAGADVKVAKEKGLVAVGVDKSSHCVKRFRNNGGVAVCDNLLHVLGGFDQETISGAILDEVCGITQKSIDHLFIAHRFDVVAGNYLRGRDKHATAYHHAFHNFQRLTGDDITIHETSQGRLRKVKVGNHRGKMMWVISVVMFVDHFHPEEGIVNSPDVFRRHEFYAAKIARPSFFTYRSRDSRQYFDSCVWNRHVNMRQGVLPFVKETTRRKVAAAKAVMTMRRNTST